MSGEGRRLVDTELMRQVVESLERSRPDSFACLWCGGPNMLHGISRVCLHCGRNVARQRRAARLSRGLAVEDEGR